MMPNRMLLLLTLSILAPGGTLSAQEYRPTTPPAVALDNTRDDARTILERYARAWRGRQEMALPDTAVVGFRIRGEAGGEYHIVVPPDGPATLDAGVPADHDVVFETDIGTLRRIDRGELSALTAMGQARASDPIPLVPHFPESFRWTPEAQALYLPFAFHFWNREWPETIRFGAGTTRGIHGANAAIFFYDQGLRTGWYQVEEGMHINADPTDQVNPFPSLFIVTRGVLQFRLDGEERTMQEGQAVFVPAGMRHEIWAEDGQYGEFVLIMFGEGA